MKEQVKNFLQKILGYDNYLYFFSRFSIARVGRNKYEKEFTYFLNMLNSKSIVLDIGANIGITTVPIAKICTQGKVYAFEPIPSNVKALKRIIDFYKLKNVSLFEQAAGDVNGSVQMVLPVINNNKMQGLSHVVEKNNDDEWNKGEFFTIPVKRLDDMPELKPGIINAIKIDVEGFEYEVLNGAKELLLKHKPVIYCELWNNDKRNRCFELIKSLGYSIKILSGEKLVDFTHTEATNFFLCYEN